MRLLASDYADAATLVLALAITSPDILAEEVQKAIDVSEEKLCPVWALLKGNVEVDVAFQIIR